jgi:predicted transcriptional regulator
VFCSIAVKAKPCGRCAAWTEWAPISYNGVVIHRYTLLNIMKTAAIGARVSDELKHAVLQLATLSGQSVSAITEEALMEYMAWRVPQMRDLKKAIAAADRGEFASDDETAAFFAKYGA